MAPQTPQKIVGKRLSLAILVSVIVHFILLVLLGLWTVYRYVQQGDPGLEVAMEQAHEEEAVQEIEMEEVEVDDVQPQVEIELDRLTVDPLHDIPLPEIVADTQAVPTPPTPSIPTTTQDQVAFRQAGGTPNINWDQMSTRDFSEQLMEMRFFGSSSPYADVERFVRGGFDRSFFEDFTEIGDPLYAAHVLHSRVQSQELDEIFERSLPNNFIIHLRGHITPPEDGRYRFYTASDELIVVGINRQLVSARRGATSASHDFAGVSLRRTGAYSSGWGSVFFQFGDWVEMEEGQTYPIDIIMGVDGPNTRYSAMLLVEKEGEDYSRRPGGPILPILSVVPLPDEIDGEFGERIPQLHEPPALVFPNQLNTNR
ncbi:MAG: hypothetical protein LAT55_09015 [Opitutales bacterium]|nr:hypothetical protein [Opitutales bacterium]